MKGPLAYANDDTGIVVLHTDNGGGGGALTLRNGIALNPANSLGTDNTHRLHELRITGDDAVTVNVNTYAKDININTTGNVVFGGVIDAGVVDSKMKFGAVSNITFKQDTTTKTIDFNNNASTITVANARTLTAILADSTGNSVGTVEFAGSGNLTGTNDAVADGIAKIKAGANLATVTITGKYNVVEIEGANAGGKIEFANGFDLTGSINSTSGAATKLKFLGNAAISGVTGSLGNAVGDIELAAASTISFGDSVHMGTMTADDATVKIENDLTIVGAINGNNTTIDVGPNALTYQGAAALTGNVVFKTEYDQVGNTIGSITVDGGGNTLNLAGAAGVTVNLESDSVLHTVENQNYVIAKTNAGGAIVGFAGNHVVNIAERNALVKWEFDKNTFTFTARDNVVAALLPAIVPGGGVPNAFQQVALDAIADPNATGDAAQFQEDLGRMTLAQQQEAIEDALTNTTTNEVTTNELQNVVAGVIQEMVSSAVAQNMTTITNRLNSFTPTISPGFNSMPNSLPASGSSTSVPGVIQQQSGDILGVSAGDVDTTKFGFWGSPFYSKAIQKSRDKTAGYRAAAYGGIIGFDTMPNDDMILGIAGAYIDTNVKHRNEKTGDRTKAATHLLSIYGMQQLPKNWFAQAIVSFSHSDIRNMERRLINVNNVYDTALGKYSSASVGGEILLGYSHYIPDYSMAITPMGGFRYAKFNDAGYKETGSRRNLVVAKKSTDKLEAVLGIRAVKMIEVNGVNLMPELHGSISQDLTGKAPKIDARVSGMNRALPTRAKKPPRTFYNVGTGISAKYHMMEYSLGYDLNLAKKYTGHQGTVKIRVNF
jgi:outer membrane autotransporter protein